MPRLLDELALALDDRAAQALLRRRRVLSSPQEAHITVDGREVLSFCSNDYLGLANHPALIQTAKAALNDMGLGSGASHLITGHHQIHEQLEAALASFVGQERALLFGTGYMANIGMVSALVGRNDAVFCDRLNHASLNDAVVLSRAKVHRYPHNDMTALERQLVVSTAKNKFILTDSVFSMDGDIAPVPELIALCEKYDALLLLDDAHGFGVLGQAGRGVLEHFGIQNPRIVVMATLGKAAGVAGAFVAGAATMIETLIQQSRPYIYTTASPPMLAAALLESLRIIQDEPERRHHLQNLIGQLRLGLSALPWKLADSATPIQPLMVGDNASAMRLSEQLLEQGVLVPAIRPPTVPVGTARLRISLSASHNAEDVDALISALYQSVKA